MREYTTQLLTGQQSVQDAVAMYPSFRSLAPAIKRFATDSRQEISDRRTEGGLNVAVDMLNCGALSVDVLPLVGRAGQRSQSS